MQLAWEQRELELERQLDQQEDEDLSRAEMVIINGWAARLILFGLSDRTVSVFRRAPVQSPCQTPASLLLISWSLL